VTSTAMSRLRLLTFLGLFPPRLAFGALSGVRADRGSIAAAGGVAEIAGYGGPACPVLQDACWVSLAGQPQVGGLARRRTTANRRRLRVRLAAAAVHLADASFPGKPHSQGHDTHSRT